MLKNPELNKVGDAALYGVASTVPDKRVVQDALAILLEEVLDI